MKSNLYRKFILLLLTCILLVSISPYTQVNAISLTSTARSKAVAQLAALSPEERVGQLVLITFNGNDTSAASPV